MKLGRFFIRSLLLVFLAASPAVSASQKKNPKDLQSEQEDYSKKWLKEDVVYIITDEEKAVFQKLSTPEEKEKFIEDFWARRDPDPRTPTNEFREEHYRRIVYANEHFTSGDPGWKTDRGRIYIIHGPPDAMESRPTGGAYVRPIEEGGGTTAVHPYEKWRYRYIEGLGSDIELEFVDPTGTGEFHLAVFPWEKDALLHTGGGKTLAEQTGLATRADHPALMPAAGGAGYGPESMYRRAKDTPFARYELFARAQAPPVIKYKALKELVQVNIKYNTLPFEFRGDYFKLNDAQALVPITVQVRNRDLTFKSEGESQVARMAVYGSVTSLTNRVVHEFEDEIVTLLRKEEFENGLQKQSVYQKIIPLNGNMRYRLDLILKDLNSGNVGVIQKSLIPPSLSSEILSASSLILSNSIRPLEWVPIRDEMFVLGNVKIIPKMDKRFTRQMPLGVYLQIYNAGMDPTSLAPSLKVLFKLLKDGQVLKVATDEKGESTQFYSVRRVVLVRQLNLADLEPGKYQIQVEVIDQLNDRKIEATDDFTVVEEAPASHD